MTDGPAAAPDRILVVGAGMAGLTAATELERHGVATIVVDKGRAPGGRMASRTIGNARYDHGAQHFSARHPTFRAEVERWRRAGVAREWFRGPSRTRPERGTEPRHAGVGGMRRVPEHLAERLDVHTGTRLGRIERTPTGVTAVTDDGRVIPAAGAILTPPLPQLLDLIDAGGVPVPTTTRSLLRSVRYVPCLAVMAELDGASGLRDGHASPGSGPIAWLADNHHKGVSTTRSLTIHSTPEYARAHLDAEPGGWTDRLAREADRHVDGRIGRATGHAWRYSQPVTTIDEGAVALDDGPPVVLAGEVFAGARVEGAFLSGLAAAGLILTRG